MHQPNMDNNEYIEITILEISNVIFQHGCELIVARTNVKQMSKATQELYVTHIFFFQVTQMCPLAIKQNTIFSDLIN
jgi:hypothetical protein